MNTFRGYSSRLISISLALFISLFFFLFHFHYMQQFLDYDQVWYLNNIDRSLGPYGIVIFSPHHLHNEIGGKVFQQFMIANFGKAGFTDLTFNMRLRSLLFSCAGIFFLFLFLEDVTKKKSWAVLGSVLIAVTHGYLMYSTKVDTAIFPTAGLFMILWLLNRIEAGKNLNLLFSVMLGVLLFVNVMFHQYMAIACALTVLVFLLPPIVFRSSAVVAPFSVSEAKKKSLPGWENAPLKRFFHTAVMAGIGLCLIAAAYFFVGRLYYNLPFEDPAAVQTGRFPYGKYSFQRWLFLYQADQRDRWGHGLQGFNPKLSFYGFTKGMLSATGVQYLRAIEVDDSGRMRFGYNLGRFFDRNHFVFNLAAVFTLVTLAGLVLFFPVLLRRYRRVFVFCLLNFLIFSFFTTYWEPEYLEFWIIPVALLFILGIMVLNVLEEKLAWLLKKLPRLIFGSFVLVFLVAMFAHNLLYAVIPYSLSRHAEDVLYPEYKNIYMNYFSTVIYKYPDDPYKNVTTIGNVRGEFVQQAVEAEKKFGQK